MNNKISSVCYSLHLLLVWVALSIFHIVRGLLSCFSTDFVEIWWINKHQSPFYSVAPLFFPDKQFIGFLFQCQIFKWVLLRHQWRLLTFRIILCEQTINSDAFLKTLQNIEARNEQNQWKRFLSILAFLFINFFPPVAVNVTKNATFFSAVLIKFENIIT